MTPNAPIKNFKLPSLGDNGYIQWRMMKNFLRLFSFFNFCYPDALTKLQSFKAIFIDLFYSIDDLCRSALIYLRRP
jgi:hypothetical protein